MTTVNTVIVRVPANEGTVLTVPTPPYGQPIPSIPVSFNIPDGTWASGYFQDSTGLPAFRIDWPGGYEVSTYRDYYGRLVGPNSITAIPNGPFDFAGTLTSTHYGDNPPLSGSEFNLVLVLVPYSAPTATFNYRGASPSICAGARQNLAVYVTYASSVVVDQGVGAVALNQGGSSASFTVAPSVTTTYTATVTGLSGAVITCSVTVTVTPAPTVSLTASPAEIGSGGAATLTWTSANATSVSIPGVGSSLPTSGSAAVRPSATTTYTATASGGCGTATATATVTVGPIISVVAVALVPGGLCSPSPGGSGGAGAPTHAFGALAIDGVRQWLHVAKAKAVATYHCGSASLLMTSPDYPVDGWRRMRSDPRRADLLMLGVSGASHVVYRSADGGLTAEAVNTVTTNNGLIERLSERGLALFLYEDNDTDHNVFCQQSLDGGQTWGATAPAQYSGAQLQAALLDLAYDPRRSALSLVCTQGTNTIVLESKDAGEQWALKLG